MCLFQNAPETTPHCVIFIHPSLPFFNHLSNLSDRLSLQIGLTRRCRTIPRQTARSLHSPPLSPQFYYTTSGDYSPYLTLTFSQPHHSLQLTLSLNNQS